MKRKTGLLLRVLGPTLLIVLGTMAVQGWIAFRVSKDALEKGLVDQMKIQAEMGTRSLDSFVADLVRDIRLMSQNPIFSALPSNSAGKRTAAAAERRLAELVQQYDVFLRLNLADPDGRLLASSAERDGESPEIRRKRAFFRKAGSGETALSEVFSSPLNGEPVFAVALSLAVVDGVSAVFWGEARMEVVIGNLLDPLRFAETGYAFMVDPGGTTIAHPERERVLRDNVSEFDFGREILRKKSGTVRYGWGDDLKFAAFEPSERGPDGSWR